MIIDDKRKKAIMLDILKDIDAFCKEQDIKYYIMFGTLLGAVRHKDIIPWDYDIDIAMFREDYKKFIMLYKKYSKDNYDILAREVCDEYEGHIARVIDKRTQNVSKKIMGYFDIGGHICVEIYAIDYISSFYPIRTFTILYVKLLYFLEKIMSVNYLEYEKEWKKIVAFIIQKLLFFTTKKRIGEKIESIFQAKTKSDYVSIGPCRYFEAVYKEKDVREIRKYTIAGHDYWGPKKYHKLLTGLYGNYMKLPSKEDIKKSKKIQDSNLFESK